MNDERPTDELLMRYFDGDLADGKAERVAARVANDPELRGKLAALSNLQRAMDASTVEVSRSVDFDALFSRVEAGIASEAERDAVRVPSPGLFDRIGAFVVDLFGGPERLWIPAAGVAAAAAVALLIAQGGQPVAPGITPTDQAALPKPPPTRDNSDLPRPPPRVALASSEIVQVDFGDNTGTVFEIALAQGVSTPVVWINDDE